MRKFNKKSLEEIRDRLKVLKKKQLREEAHNLQVAIYVMCGGGFLGSFAVENPREFYIDDRVYGLPFSRTKIYRAVSVLTVYFDLLKIKRGDARKCRFHSCGVF